jgi:TonB family protein
VATNTKGQLPTAAPPAGAEPPVLALAGKPLIALTRDARLLAVLRAVTDPAHEVCGAGSEVELATVLMAHNAGVAVLDAAAAATTIGDLTETLHRQFPDVVLIVAGGTEHQAVLAEQIADGSVHRFLHKPLSEQRVRLFVDAAWRRHAEEHLTGSAAAAPRARRVLYLQGWLVAAAAAAVIAAPLIWLSLPGPQTRSSRATPRPALPEGASPAHDANLENLLERADKALAAGALVAPPEANAAELYREALKRTARDPRAVNGLEQVIDRLVSNAEEQLPKHPEIAQQLAEQARAINPDHPRVAFLVAQLGAQREQQILGEAQRAAASGNVAGALAVLDGATREGRRSTLVDEARQELAQKQLEERVADLLRRAREAANRGWLIEPPEHNARFLIQSARTLAPDDPAVAKAAQDLLTRLRGAARQALTAGNAEQADAWATAAGDTGADAAEVATLHQEAQRLRSAARADSVAHLAGAFNVRLADGRLLDPEADSAKFYLAQLVKADPANPATQLARSAFDTRLLDEARGAVRAQDYSNAKRWLAEARAAGADPTGVGAVDAALSSAQQDAQRASGEVNAGILKRTRYVPPVFPLPARERGIGGWVDMRFVVQPDGSVADAAIVGAQPVGIFEQAALDSVRRWRYEPVQRDGHAVSQRARVRVRFEMQQ